RFERKISDVGQVGAVINAAATRYRLGEMDVFPVQVFRVAGTDPAAKFAKDVVDDLGVAVITLRAVDDVGNVNVDAETGARDGLQQLQVGVGAVGQTPPHHLDREFRAPGFDGVEDLATVLHRGVKELPR